MKTSLIAAYLAAGLCVNAVAADFSSYSTEELLDMRGTVPVEERADFKTELQSRISVMTPEEKATYDIGNQKGQSAGQAGTMKQEQVQTRTRTSLQEGEGEQFKAQIREQKRLQERSRKDQMNQMNQMQQRQQMQQMHQMPRTKDTDTQGRR
ncbi:DUF1104 domain-containing protein [Sulfurimonas sp. HSL3-7]|uniref:DUF1104 domain-containing protein n=1 Tax=Sulfonitrofixus jiaomeiensis TaxID=3131938 RepID=UPI0031F7AEFB